MSVISTDDEDVKTAVLQELGKRGRKAGFVTEILFMLGRRGVPTGDLDRVMRDLEDQGILLVRDHSCADPHLAGADLRVAGLIAPSVEIDGTSQAVQDIEAVWQDWLAAYLANHRCG